MDAKVARPTKMNKRVRRTGVGWLIMLAISLGSHETTGAARTLVSNQESPTDMAAPAESRSRPISSELAPEALEFIRGIVLHLLPPKFDDDDGWGDEKRIQSGVHVRVDDGKLKTSRRWTEVNHGSWLQASGALVEPETTFQLHAARLDAPVAGTQRYEVRIAARLKITGRQQQWSYGLLLWSISADAVADVSLHVVFEVNTTIVKTGEGTRLRFAPNVTHAVARLDSFDLRRISHAKGSVVQEFGNGLERLIRLYVDRENKDLAAKINKAIHKKAERLEIPFEIGGWLLPPDDTVGDKAVRRPKSVQSARQDCFR